MNKEIADIIHNIFSQDRTPEKQAAVHGGLARERGNLLATDPRRTAELKEMIAIQEKLVMRMINNGDEEEYQPPPPRKPRLRIIK